MFTRIDVIFNSRASVTPSCVPYEARQQKVPKRAWRRSKSARVVFVSGSFRIVWAPPGAGFNANDSDTGDAKPQNRQGRSGQVAFDMSFAVNAVHPSTRVSAAGVPELSQIFLRRGLIRAELHRGLEKLHAHPPKSFLFRMGTGQLPLCFQGKQGLVQSYAACCLRSPSSLQSAGCVKTSWTHRCPL